MAPKHPKFLHLASLLAQNNCTLGPVCVVKVGSPGVILPAMYNSFLHVKLQVGYNVEPAIPDLTLNDHGWSGTLLFKTLYFRCQVPWQSIVYIDSGISGLREAHRVIVPNGLPISSPSNVFSLDKYRKKTQSDKEPA